VVTVFGLERSLCIFAGNFYYLKNLTPRDQIYLFGRMLKNINEQTICNEKVGGGYYGEVKGLFYEFAGNSQYEFAAETGKTR
jgi:hypothetical protein